MRPRFVDEALAEFIAAGRYYIRQLPGLGDAFVDEVATGIGVILKGPVVWRVIEDDVRRFPYGIYKTIESEEIVIWAVKHLHRDPHYWQHRRGS
jgi:toxin ParE1/3/4